jgi:dihydroorotate dehydrogenase
LDWSDAVIGLFERFARPILRALDPEDAHQLALRGLRLMPVHDARPDDPKLAVHTLGLTFSNPVGVAPGFDKNAEVPDALLRLGFGFVEVGTVTPRPQAGNPRPRVFRLDADEAVINRFGFYNDGQAAVAARLAGRIRARGIVGVNVGANRDSADRIADYVRLIQVFAPISDYITVNVSSPNTPGLRDLQQARSLDDLLARITEARQRAQGAHGATPVLLKVAPDVGLADLDDIVAIARRRGLDGMIIGNTTLSRPPSLRERQKAIEQGGLSGRPLFALSTRVLAETYVRVEGAFPLIGVGGISSGADAVTKIKAGASLVQLYTGLIFHGISLLGEIKRDLLNAVENGRHAAVADLVGQQAASMTAQPWPV